MLIALLGFNVYRSPIKRHYGFSEEDSVLLVCGDALGEGMLISEVAARESRPGHIVLRASKMLASEGWMGSNYRTLFQDQREVLQYLEDIPTGIVIIDESGRRTPHGQLLYRAIESHPQRWELLSRSSQDSRVDDILVYRLIGHEGRPISKIRIPMLSGLYGRFEN